MTQRFLLVGIFLFTLVWALLLPSRLLVPSEDTFSHDPGAYNQAAIHLAQEGFYSTDGITPTFEREPGYSTFLAVVYTLFGIENRLAIFFIQGVLTLLAALFLYQELRQLMGERIAMIFLFLFLALPSVWHTIFSAYRENFALVLLLLFTTSFLRFQRSPSWGSATLAGVLLSAIILTYIPFLFFPLFLLPLFWFSRVRVGEEYSSPTRYFLVLLLPYLVVSLWGVRNTLQGVGFSVAAPERSTIVQHVRGEQAEYLRGFEPFRCLWSEYISRDWTGRPHQCSYNAVMHALGENPRFLEDPAGLATEGRWKILAFFPHYLWFSLVEVLELHLPFVNGWGFSYNVLAALSTIVLFIGILLSLPFIFRREYGIFLALIFYSTALYSLTDATPRYLMPVLFCYALLSAVGYGRILGGKFQYRRSA